MAVKDPHNQSKRIVLDPYDEVAKQELVVPLEGKRRELTQKYKEALSYLWCLPASIPVGLLLVFAGQSASVAKFIFQAMGVLWSVTVLGIFAFRSVHKMRMRKLEQAINAIEVRSYPVSYHTDNLLTNLNYNLRQLPAEDRAELRPLWDAVLEANAYLLENPAHTESLERIKIRVATVETLAEGKRQLAAAEKQAVEAQRVKDLEARAPNADDEDLAVAQQAIEAVAEGQRQYRSVADLLPSPPVKSEEDTAGYYTDHYDEHEQSLTLECYHLFNDEDEYYYGLDEPLPRVRAGLPSRESADDDLPF